MAKQSHRPAKAKVMQLSLDYRPFPSQARFHAAPGHIILGSGGVGAGKTQAGAVEALALALENDESDGFIVAPTWGTLHRVTLRKFLEVCPKKLIVDIHKQERYIILANGARVNFGSADRPDTLEGATIAWFWGDECRYWRRTAYDVMIARMRCPKAKRMRAVLTSTPTMGWLYDEFCTGKPGRTLVNLPTIENQALPKSYMQDLRTSYSKAQYEQYVLGQFRVAEGTVFGDMFDYDTHIVDLEHIPDVPVDIGYDFAVRRPAVVFAQRIGDEVRILDEIIVDDCPTDRMARKIRKKFLTNPHWHPGTVYCDPAGAARGQATGVTSVEILEREGFVVDYTTHPQARAIHYGLGVIGSKLMNVDGDTSLFINKAMESDNQRGLVQAIQAYSYPEVKEGRPVSDLPHKDGITDHVMDALRYLLVGYFPPESSTIRSIF